MTVRPPRFRDQPAQGGDGAAATAASSAGTNISYIVESRDFDHPDRAYSSSSYDPDHGGEDRVPSTGYPSQHDDDGAGRHHESNHYRNHHHHQHDDYGVELVLNQTTDSQRARDMFISGSRRGGGRDSESSPYYDVSQSSKTKYSGGNKNSNNQILVETVESQSVESTTDSRRSLQSNQRPRSSIDAATATTSNTSRRSSSRTGFMRDTFSDGNSTTSRSYDSRNSRALFDDASESSSTVSGFMHPLREGDTIWRAAKRGDLMALKRFHSQGKVDWTAKDQFGNTPLFYACHSGAIVDISVVHFLLWVTPVHEIDLDKCKNDKNRAVMKILNDFEGSGYTNPFQRSHDRSNNRGANNMGEKYRNRSSLPPNGRSLDKPNERRNDSKPPSSGARTYKKSVEEERSVVRDKALQSIVEDVNKIHVSPSNVTNMTIDTDDWSLGSMLSFGKRLKRRKGPGGLDQRLGHNDEASLGSRSSRFGSYRSRESSLGRKVSFDDKSSKKNRFSSAGFRQSPRDRVHQAEVQDKSAPPRVEYEEDTHQWIIENHIAMESAATSNVVLTIHVFDSNQKVVVRNCHGVSIDIHGKTMKSVTIKDSSDLNIVFDSVSDVCNIVHSKNIAAETTGICRNFTMDRTKGINIWLSRESRDISKVVTSKCTEVSVLLPSDTSGTDYERQELTLPEKYTHQFAGGKMRSRVSSVANLIR